MEAEKPSIIPAVADHYHGAISQPLLPRELVASKAVSTTQYSVRRRVLANDQDRLQLPGRT
jgi:hypothetical protein